MQATFPLYKTSCKMRKATHISSFFVQLKVPSKARHPNSCTAPALPTHCAKGAPKFLHTARRYPPPLCQTNNFVLKKYSPNGCVRWTSRSVHATILGNGGNTSLGTRHFKVQTDGDLQLVLFRVEALVADPLLAEKLNMLPGFGALLVLGTGRSGSLIWLRDLWDGHRMYSTS